MREPARDIDAQTFVFRLFVAGNEFHSRTAINNLEKICESYFAGQCRIQILDVFKSLDLALKDGIFLTPALVKISPGPRAIVYGDLSDTEKVLQVLEPAGGKYE